MHIRLGLFIFRAPFRLPSYLLKHSLFHFEQNHNIDMKFDSMPPKNTERQYPRPSDLIEEKSPLIDPEAKIESQQPERNLSTTKDVTEACNRAMVQGDENNMSPSKFFSSLSKPPIPRRTRRWHVWAPKPVPNIPIRDLHENPVETLGGELIPTISRMLSSWIRLLS